MLTGSALAVWNEIDGVSSQEDIARHLAGAFNRGRAAILEDVSAFLVQLADAHIIVSAAEASVDAARRAS
ncbi:MULTISPECIES: PqqD family protein [unclassified Rathayibacter]|uniref:PqqD family protein n=1 Tax=unclassified Rathayibacter TaxID=2609250 RepID=UPI00267E1175